MSILGALNYPTKRTVIRFDAGDTIIRFHGQDPKEINPSSHDNLQMNLGFGFRSSGLDLHLKQPSGLFFCWNILRPLTVLLIWSEIYLPQCSFPEF